jgi:tetratricopeptide (TPR) repeat protein
MYGKGLALARLGKHEEAIEYYDKIIETSEKYLLDTLQSIATFIDLYKITFSAFYEKWNSLNKLRKFLEASLCFDKTKEYLEAWPPEDKTFRTWENFWLYRAKTISCSYCFICYFY